MEIFPVLNRTLRTLPTLLLLFALLFFPVSAFAISSTRLLGQAFKRGPFDFKALAQRTPRLPLAPLPPKTQRRVSELGGKPVNLYRVLAHQPKLLDAWVEFAYQLRQECKTPRDLRELMILRGAQLSNSGYAWSQHVPMALKAGLNQAKIDTLSHWQTSDLYDAKERATLAFLEEIMKGEVSDSVSQKLKQHFTPDEYIELTLTASFYAMVPRVIDALQVPLETDNAQSDNPNKNN